MKIKLVLRIVGSTSLLLFFTLQILQIDNCIKSNILYASAFCFLLVFAFRVVKYLKENYYK
jgi:hypothetical protein